MEYDTQLRLLLLGDGGAGKSSLLVRFTDDVFVPQTSTLGVDFRTKLITLLWQRVRLQLWDTNGQERFRSITRSYYRGAHGVALVFDTCDAASFGNVSRWVADIRQHKTVEDIAIIICANKVRNLFAAVSTLAHARTRTSFLAVPLPRLTDRSLALRLVWQVDMVDERVVTHDEGSSLAAQMGCEYFETSAKTGAGVEDAFMAMAEHIMCGGPRRERRKLLAARQRLLWARAATVILANVVRARSSPSYCTDDAAASVPTLLLRARACDDLWAGTFC
jgi:small GTP-binding protein